MNGYALLIGCVIGYLCKADKKPTKAELYSQRILDVERKELRNSTKYLDSITGYQNNQPFTECPKRRLKSFHPKDIEYRYCDNCKCYYNYIRGVVMKND